MKAKNFISFITLQLIIIFVLGFKIYQRQKNILGTISVNPINKESIVLKPSNELKYFYEPMANTDSKQEIVGFNNKYAQYHTNEDTLRNDKEYLTEKGPQTYRITTIGDSFTFGYMVNDGNSYPKQLENKFKTFYCDNYDKFEIINLGVGGYDIQYAVERFRIRGKKYNPDLIIWLLKDDDFTQIAEIIESDIRKNVQMGLLMWDGKKHDWSAIDKATKEFTQLYGEKTILELQSNYLVSINKYTNGKILLISMTDNDKYNNIMQAFTAKIPNSYFLKIRLKNNMSFIDGHPTEKGYQSIAEDLFKYITENKIIPCD